MKIVVCLLALTALAAAEPKKELSKTDVARWDQFPGPEVAPPVTEKEAFVVSPTQSGTWDRMMVFFVLAPIVEAKPHALVLEGPFHRFEVPGAFVGPPLEPAKVAVGSYVLFQKSATMTMAVDIGRVAKVGKDSYSIKYDFVDDVSVDEVPANHVLPIDGKLHFGVPVSFELDGQRVLAWYVGPGREPGASWVVNVWTPVEHRDLTPLTIRAFKKGAKVLAQHSTVSVMHGDEKRETRQPLQNATVVEVRKDGLAYKVRIDDGDEKGQTYDVSTKQVFAR